MFSLLFTQNTTSLVTLLVTKCRSDFPSTKQFSATPTGYPTIQLTSNTTYYLEIVSDYPTIPQTAPIPPQMSATSTRSQGYLQLDYKSELPMTPNLINLLECCTELRETLIYLYLFIKE